MNPLAEGAGTVTIPVGVWDAVRRVVQALDDEGAPGYHREIMAQIMAQHRRRWPILWNALDALRDAVHAEEEPKP